MRALEVNHCGARLGRDTDRGYNGYVLTREGHALLFGGDTAHTPLFASYRAVSATPVVWRRSLRKVEALCRQEFVLDVERRR